ncbi:two-component system, response regulator YesN [Paenibacillus catalpae]|uniref:Two-component system, response regulator YesN n=1 Tax=Paenibacillus catalpae TaxID=1045775 RepID=A0A1I1TDI4_9BACL|nr:response regulator [Paenibacillus catalpae]SFD53540.1 two-component system, response regulator YesN [Paenibacillus catalpae]
MRLLIADDDDYTREGLSESIDFEKFGIQEVFLACDGAEALRLAALKKPDIVLTDVRMPKLNGIEFAEKLAETNPGCQLLFMSGYMDVDYLKSAIKLSAVEYIEKPLKLAEVEQAILKSVLGIQSKQKQTAVLNQKNELERQRLVGLLRDTGADQDTIKELCQETGFPLGKRYVGMIMFSRNEDEHSRADLDLINRYWSSTGVMAIGEQLDRYRCFVIAAYDKQDFKRINYLADLFVRQHDSYSIGMGEAANRLEELPESYRLAYMAAERSFYYPDIRFYSRQEERTQSKTFFTNLLPEFYKRKDEHPEQLPQWVESSCSMLREQEYADRARIIALFETAAIALVGGNQKLLIQLENDYGIRNVEQSLRDCRTLDSLEMMMRIICGAYLEEVQRSSPYSRLIQDVIQYIASNYRNPDLDLRTIADHMHLSTAHLGMLFKQETGTSIKQYISDYRIGLAKKLVMSEHYKMNTIAELCGYASASYFAKVFKASTDLSPLEYRKKT